MRNMGLPVIVHVLHSLEGGGTERALVSLLRAFDPHLARHVVVPLRAAGSLSARLGDHVSCRPLQVTGRSWSLGLKLGAIVRALGAAVIHARNTGSWHDATVARMVCPRARLVLGFHGLESGSELSRRQRLKARVGVRLGARFTSVSETGRRQLQLQAGAGPDRIAVLPNGVDLRRFRGVTDADRSRLRRQMQLAEGDLVVGIVGSLTVVKRHAWLIRAVAELANRFPRLRLLVVGDGPLREQLTEQAAATGIGKQVRFAGWREDVPAVLAAMDVYVCCSVSEGMNNALLEAMAAGLPVIATDVGDNAKLLRDGKDGRIVTPPSWAALAAVLAELIRSAESRDQLGTAARARAQAFDFADTVRAYETYYQKLITGPGYATTSAGRATTSAGRATTSKCSVTPCG